MGIHYIVSEMCLINDRRLLIFFRFFHFTASRNSNCREEDFALQARESEHVCMGNSRSTVIAEDLRSKHNTVSEFCQQDFEKRWIMVG